jgi:transposase-like protein
MPRPRKYPDELIQRGVRLAIESGRPVRHVAADLGIYCGRRLKTRPAVPIEN